MTHLLLAASPNSKPLIRLDKGVVPTHYSIDLTVDPKKNDFDGTVKIELELASRMETIVLHSAQLTFDKIEVQSGETKQTATPQLLSDDGTIELHFVNAVGPGRVELSFAYHATLSTGLEGLYKVVDQGSAAVFTQFQAIGARRAFPCFDEPGFKTNFDLSLRVPKKLVAISNTREMKSTSGDDGYVIHHFATTKPLPTYLIAFAVGDFDVVEANAIPPSAMRKGAIPLRGIAMRGSGEELAIALKQTAKLVLLEEEYFGIAYPFDKLDIIAVPDFGAGGMENAGAITYDESIVLLDDDATLQRRRDFLSIHAHEIAHQWFGNLASPRWWDDLWLNESFASFMEIKFAAMMEPDWRFDTDILASAHEAMLLDRAASVRRVREPVIELDGISAAFDAITYQKGAVLLTMVEDALGADAFRKFVHDFLIEHAFGTMDTNSFLTALNNRPGGDIAARMLSAYIYQPGLPLVKLSADESGLQLSQSRFGEAPTTAQWHIPVCFTAPPNETLKCYAFGTSRLQISGNDWKTKTVVPIYNIARYYLFDVPRDQWLKILDALPAMPRSQALAVAINLDMAFIDGRVEIDTYLKGVDAIAQHQDWEVAGFPLTRMESLASEAAQCPAIADLMRVKIAALYAPQLKSIGLNRNLDGKGVETWLLQLRRQHLVDAFASGKADPHLQMQLAEKGEALAKDPEEQLDDSEIAPSDIVGAALVAAATNGGAAFLDLAETRMKNTDDLHERELWLHAIAASPAAGASAKIEQLLLSPDLRNKEVPDLLFARAAQQHFRDETWDIVQRNATALLARLEGDLEISLIQIADGFASEAQAQRVEKTITPLLGKLRGGGVQLQQTLERIRDNAALLKRLDNEARCHLAAR